MSGLLSGRSRKLTPEERAAWRAKKKAQRLAKNERALNAQRRHQPFYPKPSKNDSAKWRLDHSTNRMRRAANPPQSDKGEGR